MNRYYSMQFYGGYEGAWLLDSVPEGLCDEAGTIPSMDPEPVNLSYSKLSISPFIADSPIDFDNDLVVSQAFADLVQSFDPQAIRRYPVKVGSWTKGFELFCVTRVLAGCMDRVNSRYRFNESRNRIGHIESLKLLEDQIGDSHIFRIEESPRLLIVSEALRTAIVNHLFAGMYFRNVEDLVRYLPAHHDGPPLDAHTERLIDDLQRAITPVFAEVSDPEDQIMRVRYLHNGQVYGELVVREWMSGNTEPEITWDLEYYQRCVESWHEIAFADVSIRMIHDRLNSLGELSPVGFQYLLPHLMHVALRERSNFALLHTFLLWFLSPPMGVEPLTLQSFHDRAAIFSPKQKHIIRAYFELVPRLFSDMLTLNSIMRQRYLLGLSFWSRE